MGLQGRVAGQGRAITATERCAPVWARGMGREEKRPLRRRLEAQKAVGPRHLGRRLGEAPGRQCGPKAIQALRRSPTGHLRHEGASSPRRPALPLPLSGRRKLDHAALPPPGNPPTSCGAHSRRAASSRGPRAWVHVQCTRSARAVYKQSRAVHARKRVRLGASSAGGRLT